MPAILTRQISGASAFDDPSGSLAANSGKVRRVDLIPARVAILRSKESKQRFKGRARFGAASVQLANCEAKIRRCWVCRNLAELIGGHIRHVSMLFVQAPLNGYTVCDSGNSASLCADRVGWITSFGGLDSHHPVSVIVKRDD